MRWPVLAFSYSGIAHHDILATGYLVTALYLIEQLNKGKATETGLLSQKPAARGVLLGLTITTSMLPFFMVVLSSLYFLSLRRWQLLPIFLVRSLRRSAATLCLRRNQLRQSIPAAECRWLRDVRGHLFYFDPRNFGDKLAFYASSVAAYVPVFAVGLLGLSYYPRQLKRGTAVSHAACFDDFAGGVCLEYQIGW